MFQTLEVNLHSLQSIYHRTARIAYVVISGAQNNGASSPAELGMDVFLTGSAVNRIPPSMLLQTSGLTVCKDYKVQFLLTQPIVPKTKPIIG